jgi:hypothetical protein
VQPTSERVGRVEIYPNYGTTPDESEKSILVGQFAKCLGEQTPDAPSLKSQGFRVLVSADYPVVKKYLEKTVMKAPEKGGPPEKAGSPKVPWVQLVPSGGVAPFPRS